MRAHIGVKWCTENSSPVAQAALDILLRLDGVSDVRIERQRSDTATLSYRWKACGDRLPRVEAALAAAGIRLL